MTVRVSVVTALVLCVLVGSIAGARVHPRDVAVPGLGPRKLPQGWSESAESAVDPHQAFEVRIGIRRRDMKKAVDTLYRVSDPREPSYGDHLTLGQIAAIVAPPKSHVEAVTAWVRVRGGVRSVNVTGVRDMVTFVADVATVEKLFGVQFAVYVSEHGGLRVTRALGAVHMPKYLHAIVDVVSGFRGFPLPPRRTIKSNARSQLDNITPQVIFATYNVTVFPPSTPRNIQSFFQSVGQYVEPSDLSSFCLNFFKGVNCTIEKYVDNPNQPGLPGLESSLDSEYIMGANKGAVRTWVFTYASQDFCGDLIQWGTDVLNLNTTTPRPYVISMSYGVQAVPDYCAGPDVQRLSDDVALIGLLGISVIIASGDDGSGQYYGHGCCYNNGYLGPSFPASIPYATSVGSTTFITGNSGPEMATNEFGSGGGFSWDYNLTSAPYQAAAVKAYLASGIPLPPANMTPVQGRGTPDVSALGWNFNVLSGGQWEQVGGTSASTPTFAGLVSLLNNERLKVGKTLGFLNLLLYQNPQAFHDVTVGTDAISPDSIGFNCTKGWDPVTGLGTPNFGLLLDIVRRANARDEARARKSGPQA